MLSAEESVNYVKNFQHVPLIEEQLHAQSKVLGYSENQKIDSQKLYLCHVTSFFPKKGIIIPRMKVRGAIPSTYSSKDRKLMSLLFEGLSIVSPTVHFSLNSIAEVHDDHAGFQENSFIILDKFENNKEQIAGGYIEDLFCIGCFRLSHEATILVPKWYENGSSLQKKIKSLSNIEREKWYKNFNDFQEAKKQLPAGIQIIYFNTSFELALKQFFTSQGSDYMSLVSRENKNMPAFFGKISSEKISSIEIMKLVKGFFCTFDITPMAQIEELLCANEMKPVYPYLEVLQDSKAKNRINSYIIGIYNIFISENNDLFIKQYSKAIMNLIDFLLNSKNHDEFEKNWVSYEELIVQHDQINLNHKIKKTQATKVLAYMTGLSFSSYKRSEKSTIVDAVHEVSTQKGTGLSNSNQTVQLQNPAVELFKGDDTAQHPSHLQFKTWYHPDICHYLLQMVPNQAQCLRVNFADSGYDNNRKTFKLQLESLIVLGNLLNRPAIFISKEPGANNHFICGLVKANDVLLINSLGITSHVDCYQVLGELQKEGMIKKVWLSSTILQRKEYEEVLVSCGPICLGLAMHLLSQFTLARIQQFWADLPINEPTDHHLSGLIYYGISIHALLPDMLQVLLAAPTQNQYQAQVCAIRQQHGQDLANFSQQRAHNARVSIVNYVKSCLESSPAQVAFNLLVHQEKAAYNLSETAAYKLLQNALNKPEEKFTQETESQTCTALERGIDQLTAEKLRDRFNIHNFFNLKLKDQYYIVFPGVNLPENQKILSLTREPRF